MRTADLEAEWGTAQQALSRDDADELDAAGMPRGVIMHMIGIGKVKVVGGLYMPSGDGHWAYISPIRAEHIDRPCSRVWGYQYTPILGGDLVDLVCWDLRTPQVWALRTGEAEWAGCIVGNDPTPIRRNPIAWLYARCAGLVVLTKDRVRRWEILRDCNDIIAEDQAHSEQLKQWLVYPHQPRSVYLAYGVGG